MPLQFHPYLLNAYFNQFIYIIFGNEIGIRFAFLTIKLSIFMKKVIFTAKTAEISMIGVVTILLCHFGSLRCINVFACVLFLLVIPVVTQAQTTTPNTGTGDSHSAGFDDEGTSTNGPVFAIKGGLNLSSLKTRAIDRDTGIDLFTDLDVNIKPSLYVGGSVEFSLGDPRNKIQVELLYLNNGAIIGEGEDKITLRFSELLIPVIGKHRIADNFYLYGGSYVGVVLRVEEKYDGDAYDASEEYSNFNIGLTAGLEYNLDSGLFFEARYNFDLTNSASVVEEEDYPFPPSEDYEIKNRFALLGLGYKF